LAKVDHGFIPHTKESSIVIKGSEDWLCLDYE